jgi:hypothetical protein
VRVGVLELGRHVVHREDAARPVTGRICTPENIAAAPASQFEQVRAQLRDDLVAGRGVEVDRDLVRHRAARPKMRRFLSGRSAATLAAG